MNAPVNAMEWLLYAWAALACLGSVVVYARGLMALLGPRRLDSLEPAAPARWPRLSVVVPACNERDTIAAAIETLRAQDYPDLEIVLVDDRSTDGTGAVIDQMAASDRRIVAVHVVDLPDGWLGKVHALDVGVQKASGEFVLFTDADVHFAPAILRKAVALCEAEDLDHLAAVPKVLCRGPLLESAVSAMGLVLLDAFAGAGYAGVGAFNLVRRAAFDRTEGFEWLKMEVADDAGLGLLLHRAGARASLVLSRTAIEVAWYPSLGALVRGLEKNMFAVIGHYGFGRLLATVAVLGSFVLAPPVALVVPGPSYLWMLGALSYAAIAALAIAAKLHVGRRLLPMALTPLAQIILAAIVLRSGWRVSRRGAVEWRGTSYPLAALRAGQRVKL